METERLVCHRCGYVAQNEGETTCPRDGFFLVAESEHLRAPRDLFLGTTLGNKYPVIGIIGAGGMGSVYRAIQPILQREVAIKVILPSADLDAEDSQMRFLREAQTIALLNHPSVVTLFDFGVESDGTLFMVQELVKGRTLYELLRKRSLSCRQFILIILQVLDALDAAHQQGIVHRDIKPENIMVLDEQRRSGSGPRVKVLDFGLAMMFGPSSFSRLTRTGLIFGTPHYMSPEQSAGEHMDDRTDVYSLSAMFYEGLVGHPLFESTDPRQLFAMRLLSEAPPLPPLTYLPSGLPEIVAKGLAHDRDERSRAAEMAAALRELSLGPETDELLPGPRSQAKTPPALPTKKARTLSEIPLRTLAQAGLGNAVPAPAPLKPDSGDAGRRHGKDTGQQESISVHSGTLPGSESRSRSSDGPPTWTILAGAAGLAAIVLLIFFLLRGSPGGGLRVTPENPPKADGRATASSLAATPPPAVPRAPAAGSGLQDVPRPALDRPAPERKTLHIVESEPSGGEVRDAAGRVLGNTPLRHEAAYAPGGLARYTVSLPGYKPVTFELGLEGEQQARKVTLQKIEPKSVLRSQTARQGTGIPADLRRREL